MAHTFCLCFIRLCIRRPCFLSNILLHNEHGFKQAPFEEITKEKYEELIKHVIPITSGNIKAQADNELTSECIGGSCPVR